MPALAASAIVVSLGSVTGSLGLEGATVWIRKGEFDLAKGESCTVLVTRLLNGEPGNEAGERRSGEEILMASATFFNAASLAPLLDEPGRERSIRCLPLLIAGEDDKGVFLALV